MEKFDIIGQLREVAKLNDWRYIAGDDFEQNIQISNDSIDVGQLILTAQFESRPTFVNGRVTDVRYVGAIGLGRKFDDEGEVSSLDEDYLQKYDRRLNELMTLLANFVGEFACGYELDVLDCTFINQLNSFDSNIDFIIGNITLEQ